MNIKGTGRVEVVVFSMELINCMGEFDELKLNAIHSCRKFELDGREFIAAESSPLFKGSIQSAENSPSSSL